VRGGVAAAVQFEREVEHTGNQNASSTTVKLGEVGDHLRVAEIYFQTDEHKLDTNDEQTIEKVLMAYDSIVRGQYGPTGQQEKQGQLVHFYLYGNADPRKGEEYNLKLSERRAKEVAKRFQWWFGKSNPLAPIAAEGWGIDPVKGDEHDPEALRESRRVDIFVETRRSRDAEVVPGDSDKESEGELPPLSSWDIISQMGPLGELIGFGKIVYDWNTLAGKTIENKAYLQGKAYGFVAQALSAAPPAVPSGLVRTGAPALSKPPDMSSAFERGRDEMMKATDVGVASGKPGLAGLIEATRTDPERYLNKVYGELLDRWAAQASAQVPLSQDLAESWRAHLTWPSE
jgi:outer membrane protein OmpA-like peptidoglycan-associated protein